MDVKTTKTSFFVFLGIAIILFIYVTLRAFIISYTHDESLTFTIITGESGWILTANNHWLNTILSYLSAQLFGYSELALRLPNVISLLLYSYFCYKLVVEKSAYIFSTIISLVFLMLNPFLIEFFALSRGYGLAMAFLSGSLFYFLKCAYVPDDKKTLVAGLILSILTIYSNYSFFIPIFVIQLAYIIHVHSIKRKRLFWRQQLLFFSIEMFALIPALVNIFKLKKRNQLYFGGTENIIEDTLFSIVSHTFYTQLISNQNGAILLLAFVPILCGLIINKRISLKFLLSVLTTLFLLPIGVYFTLGIKYCNNSASKYYTNSRKSICIFSNLSNLIPLKKILN